MTEISVSWPTAPLSPQQWTARLTDLAERAELMVGRRCSPQAQATLAVEAFGLLWSGWSPELIAGSARATLLLQLPVILSTAPADQCREISERLDHLWSEAQPTAVEVLPLLDLPPPPAAAPPPPQTWWAAGDVCEVLGICRSTLDTWRRAGRLGEQGVSWVRYRGATYYEPGAVEQVESAA